MKRSEPMKANLQFIKFLTGLALFLSFSSVPTLGHSAELLKLKPLVEVSSSVVTIGDLFENVREYQKEAVFRSPALGREGSIGINRIIDMADRYGIKFDIPISLREITISRPSRTIKMERIEKLVAERVRAADKRFADGNIEIAFTGTQSDFKIPLEYSKELTVEQFTYDRYSKRVECTIKAGGNRRSAFKLPIAGIVTQTFLRPVITRAIERNETIQVGDVEMKAFPKRRIPAGIIERATEIVGMAPKQNLRRGIFVRASDLEKPKLVKKNELVTLIYRKAGMILKTQGKAISDGSDKQSISVLNIHSKRIVHGMVTGPGTITVAPAFNSIPLQKTANLN